MVADRYTTSIRASTLPSVSDRNGSNNNDDIKFSHIPNKQHERTLSHTKKIELEQLLPLSLKILLQNADPTLTFLELGSLLEVTLDEVVMYVDIY